MPSRFSILTASVAFVMFFDAATAFARGGGGGGRGGGGGGGRSSGGGGGSRGGSSGSFSRPSSGGGGGSYSRPSGSGGSSRPSSGGGNYSRPSGGDYSRPSGGGGSTSRPSGSGGANRPSQLPSGGSSKPSGGRVPSKPSSPSKPAKPSQLPAGGNRPSGGGGSASQLPAGNRPNGGAGNRPAQNPGRPGAGNAGRPSQLPANPGQRPGKGDLGNFLGVAGGVAGGALAGGALADRAERPTQLPSTRPGIGDRPGTGQRPARPEQRPNWNERSEGRNEQWQQRVDNRNDAWNQRSDNREQARSDFQQNRDQRWNNLDSAREDRQNWRDQNRDDWQNHREDLWDYRGDRANEVWDNARDFYDDVFDDRWWGGCGWGVGWTGHYPSNPWWWWAPVAFGATVAFVDGITPDPIYVDYGMNVIYEGETVYVDNEPVPAAQYSQPMIDLAVNVEQPPPPLPPAPPAPPAPGAPVTAAPAEEWLPLGVFALAQEEKGDPVLFFQISVNREGTISGGYKSTISDDQRPIAGQVDKASQRVAWRIGENKETIFVTSLANLTQDVSPLAIHFGKTRTQTWLLVRMPAPAPAGQPEKLPETPITPPPLKKKTK